MESQILPENATRELLENNVLDAEIHFADTRRELQNAGRLVALQRARLEYFEYLMDVEEQYGAEMARQVAELAAYPTVTAQ